MSQPQKRLEAPFNPSIAESCPISNPSSRAEPKPYSIMLLIAFRWNAIYTYIHLLIYVYVYVYIHCVTYIPFTPSFPEGPSTVRTLLWTSPCRRPCGKMRESAPPKHPREPSCHFNCVEHKKILKCWRPNVLRKKILKQILLAWLLGFETADWRYYDHLTGAFNWKIQLTLMSALCLPTWWPTWWPTYRCNSISFRSHPKNKQNV